MKTFTRQWIKQTERLYFVIEQFHAQCLTVGISGINIDNITTDTIGGAAKIGIIACILQFRQTAQNTALVYLFTSD